MNTNGDPAGVSWLLHNTMKKHGIHSTHILGLRQQVNPLLQGIDLCGDKHVHEVANALSAADIIHVNGFVSDTVTKPKGHYHCNLDKYLSKPFILHNHGGSVLLDPTIQLAEATRLNTKFRYVVCSPLTKHIIPSAKWLPNITPINDSMYKPVKRNFNGTLLVCQKIFSDDVRSWKGTRVLIDTINVWLNGQYKYDIEFNVFSGLQIADCLKQTAKYHICIDNITQGFIGMSGWESLAKGQVVIARLDPLVEYHYKMLGDGNCPIINVSGMDELAKVLRTLFQDRDLLYKKCVESRKWMEKYYTPKKIMELYLKFYKKVINDNKIKNKKTVLKK